MNTQVKPKATILDLDALMDTNLDSVPTVPDYITPPPGLYVLVVEEAKIEKYDIKEDGKKTGEVGNRIKIVYSVKETVSVMEGEDPVPNGSLFSESFQGSDEGIKYFKKAAMNILGVTTFENATIRDVIDGIKTAEFRARITIRRTKGDNNREYENLQIRAANPTVAD